MSQCDWSMYLNSDYVFSVLLYWIFQILTAVKAKKAHLLQFNIFKVNWLYVSSKIVTRQLVASNTNSICSLQSDLTDWKDSFVLLCAIALQQMWKKESKHETRNHSYQLTKYAQSIAVLVIKVCTICFIQVQIKIV